jgi:hypothetical protein
LASSDESATTSRLWTTWFSSGTPMWQCKI